MARASARMTGPTFFKARGAPPPRAEDLGLGRRPSASAAARRSPPFLDRAGAPPPALLLGAFAPRNGSRLALAETRGASFSRGPFATTAARKAALLFKRDWAPALF